VVHNLDEILQEGESDEYYEPVNQSLWLQKNYLKNGKLKSTPPGYILIRHFLSIPTK
jgi:hypothetical protein